MENKILYSVCKVCLSSFFLLFFGSSSFFFRFSLCVFFFFFPFFFFSFKCRRLSLVSLKHQSETQSL